jgi:hypothetical protein
MTNLLEESRNLMPGRGHANWNLNEAKAVGKGQQGLLRIAQESKGRWTGLSDVTYRDVPVHFAQLMKAAEALAKKGLIDYQDNRFRLKESVAGAPDEALAISEALQIRQATHRGKAGFSLSGKVAGYAHPVRIFTRTRKAAEQVREIYKGAKGSLSAADHEKINGLLMGEGIVGAAGPFAISDAPKPTLQDMKADLIDRCRRPRWEYPSWALPKVALDEEGMGAEWDAAVSAFDKARDYATAAKAMKRLKAMAAGQDDSHYANAISHRTSRLKKLKARG